MVWGEVVLSWKRLLHRQGGHWIPLLFCSLQDFGKRDMMEMKSWLVRKLDLSEGELYRIVSLTPSSLPIWVWWQDKVKMARDGPGIQLMANRVVSVSLCPNCTPQHVAGTAFLPVEPNEWFQPHSMRGLDFSYFLDGARWPMPFDMFCFCLHQGVIHHFASGFSNAMSFIIICTLSYHYTHFSISYSHPTHVSCLCPGTSFATSFSPSHILFHNIYP